jgi:hypothetical protein
MRVLDDQHVKDNLTCQFSKYNLVNFVVFFSA